MMSKSMDEVNRFALEQSQGTRQKPTVGLRLIKEGPPHCYLLPTERRNIDDHEAVRRWTYGKNDKSKIVKTVLMVGETGTGKTTLINTMVNYMLGVEMEGVRYQITEEGKKSQAESQTDAIIVYEVFVEGSPLALRIIDTPGYGSTVGVEDDQQTTENLLLLFGSEDGVHRINAICLVVKAGTNRLTDSQRYIFDAVLSLFGKDIEENIVVMITHSHGGSINDVITALNKAEVPYAKDDKGAPCFFKFNNLQSVGYEEEEDVIEIFWKSSYKNMEKFFEFLKIVGEKGLKMTEDVLRERKQLEACITNLRDAITMEELKQNELKQTKKALDQNKYTYEVDEPYKALEKTEGSEKATCCTICEENCHYPGCWWVSDLSWCSSMTNNYCKMCTRKCHYSHHVKHEWIYVPKTRKATRTHEDLKKQYDKDVDIKEALEKQLNVSKKKKAELLEEAYVSIVALEKIALKKNSASIFMHLDFLIEKMREKGDEAKAQKLETLKKQSETSDTRTLFGALRNALTGRPKQQGATNV